MKKINILAAAALCCMMSLTSYAQVPVGFNYQAVVRNASGSAITSQNVGVKLSILDGTSTAVYTEARTVMTTPQGMLNVQVGDGTATTTTGSISSIVWASNAMSLKVEIDPAGGTSYADMGTSKLIGVPYAQAANSLLATSDGGQGIRGNSTSSLWLGMYEKGTYRGYLGSYSGKNEDVDFGTGGGNTLGSVHLVVAATPKLTVDSIGNVGIGTRFPRYRLQVDGITGTFNDNGIRIQNTTASTGWNFYASSSGDMIIGRTGNLGYFNGTTGAYTTVSDRRAKTNIQDINNILPKVMALAPKTYEYKFNNETHKQSIGLIAQDLYEVFPEFVSINTTNEGNPMFDKQMGVDYAGMSVVAIKAIQEQQAEIADLKARIAALEAIISKK